jgi:1-acyl-sn-glycerol-3-phosphate acyltransferase
VKLPPRRLRRCLRDPLWPPAALVLAALFLVAALVCGLAWPVTRRARAARLALLAALYLVLNATLLVGCAALWVGRPGARHRDDEGWQDAHTALLRWALGWLRRAAGPLLGFRVYLEEPPGLAELAAGPLLLLARHAGPGDSFTLVEILLSRYRRRPRIVLKETLQWDPGLDVVLNRLGACFLPARAPAGPDGTAELLADRVARLARDLRGSDAMLLFPEGRNWTPRRYQRALARLRRRALPQATADAEQNPNVLPPRPAGLLASLAARPGLGIVVIAHTGLDDLVSPAQVWQALPLQARPMTIRWWYIPPGSVPADPDRQYQWLRAQWALVDSWIGARKARAGEPGPDRPPGPDAPEAPDAPVVPDAPVLPEAPRRAEVRVQPDLPLLPFELGAVDITGELSIRDLAAGAPAEGAPETAAEPRPGGPDPGPLPAAPG